MVAETEISILVVAGGRGSRAGEGMPKQYRRLADKTVLARTLEAMGASAPGARLKAVIHPDDRALYAQSVAELSDAARAAVSEPALGGATRQESVRNGLEAVARESAPQIVLIHDAARPFADPALIARAIAAARAHGAAVPGVPLNDTVKEIDAAGFVVATPDRARLRAVQTPQSFRFPLILAAHRAAAAADREYTDDAMIAEAAGHAVHVFPGDLANFKLTTPEDFARAMDQIKAAAPQSDDLTNVRTINVLTDVRTGQGYDVHAFAEGDQVWLGGVSIPHSHSLAGHSDADVLMHAITDAVLGAIAEGDIGAHFPPSDSQWKGAASKIFLEHACKLVRARGGMIAHIDATVVCEAPKVGPHRDAIRASLAEIMELDIGRVAIKATTTEKLGFTGRREGIAALAIATVRLPE
ncbi:bifunctional 2-C-methyl-D-erythritol 4-phosphate cytidylyltransferase/2-C-methyl-D-erythritol 2,4-cyclodiphosphate synthase [Methylocystis sp. MJC1]|uniref:bifunctional 2-C-methyl-D-erythritol 4-phosphate cytidylyltransferase/2-C-methyl-D-erythritol 2,4-cyclodiphosphate synthase n=1 Tax=Methylocystis sp. MJC1 TaxID=2654282 RepID=UPI0013EB56BC|nr:bifunctional 2-C-methyl-D-erythritol 4-phosphate cytidylyltransferase/2-C-methyl-D-erythritol 2,4-cyclodiphosphate synthase [Methylocystis sp. MJC1]KAF2992136.1 Bifunctional enzyme IspD/IspF [Methylocystis sp. MJC1]MBU6527277.1 bifunctional 2-C-methyl-D-erythritol 4-phosphate cytidylyltransferase/2-C-methyl-D-erythritol 2,4-cyclodiphosphate synthase [Methylocystis sp. MJC1]UZX10234.1 bifunctional 2-C-methyl-D-erythritol 4-phosphate cytidylyltransferase/2-C-methyl-D-erythritol 2,4-cyclodiphosp